MDNGPSRCEAQGASFESGGYVAKQACCVCGGGYASPSLTPQVLGSDIPSSNPAPLPTSTVIANQILAETSAASKVYAFPLFAMILCLFML